MTRYVLLSTLQSTGTWWVIDALRKNPHVGGLAHVHNVMALRNGWVLRDGWTGNPHNEEISPDKITILYEHFENPPAVFYRWAPQMISEYLMSALPTLSPLRDPLICMIRAWHREPQLYPYGRLMNAWIHMAQREDTLGVKFWRMEPFDHAGFIAAVQGVGIPSTAEWEGSLAPAIRINSTPGECDLRQAYADGDSATIAKRLPQPWRRLRESEPILRPFLERCGFSNLLWWD